MVICLCAVLHMYSFDLFSQMVIIEATTLQVSMHCLYHNSVCMRMCIHYNYIGCLFIVLTFHIVVHDYSYVLGI